MNDEFREPTVLEGWDTVRVGENFPHAGTYRPDKSAVSPSDIRSGVLEVWGQDQTRLNSADMDFRPLTQEGADTLRACGYIVVVNIETTPNRTNWYVDWSE